ncbi:Nucleotide-sugar transporter family protein [Penicillium ucsense]|uniref:Nucleotide-sugar transporter family protein n=1 Tax=Penicillium ucsense TaxID=2839758 RepID=A0A8J8WL66_9EURO|nr:Nucleotide-sugar transporter family protein [Penicillium ucsense]KAF7734758.1 Nucleotide-sugar transporter family protein [Penicillium ucsense]
MGLSPAGTGHHRRRSSVLTGASRSIHPGPSDRRDESLRPHGDAGPNKLDEQEHLMAEDTDTSELSASALETQELDEMSSNDDQYDEETGLTASQKRQRRRRRRQRRKLDARIADVKSSRFGLPSLGLTDRTVARKLFVNAGLILLWYFFSLSISIYNKWMFSENDVVFPFPLFTTSLHMLVQFTFAALLLWIFPSLRPGAPPVSPSASPTESSKESESLISRSFYLTRLVPCGAATSLDIGLGNMSLRFISLTFLTMCKSSALAFVLLFAFLFRLESPSFKLILIIAAMTVGVVMMVAGETAFNALGFGLVIASAFFSGFRWGLTQILLLRHPATSNPFSTLFLLTPIMFVSLLCISLAVEGPSNIHYGYLTLAEQRGAIFGACLLIFPGFLAFCMISSEFALLKRSSVVTLSICGIFKEVVTISAAGVIFHDKLTVVNITGLVVTIASIGCYNYMKISKMRNEAKRDDWVREETPDSDSEELSGTEHAGRYPMANPETGALLPPTASQHNDELQTSNAGEQPHSLRVRASGAMPNLAAPSTIPEDDFMHASVTPASPTITPPVDAPLSSHLHPSIPEASPNLDTVPSFAPLKTSSTFHS